MEFNKSGIIKSPASSITNLYSGTQENYYNMSLTYNYKTDVFKEYGFDTCLRLDSPGENDTAISYSYFLPLGKHLHSLCDSSSLRTTPLSHIQRYKYHSAYQLHNMRME